MEKKIEQGTIDISLLVPCEKNPRIHTEEQIESLRESIRKYGITKNVVIDEDNVILAGNGTAKAAQLEGNTEIPFRRLIGFTEPEKMAYLIKDNKVHDDSFFDISEVQALLKEIEDMGGEISSLGFDFDTDDESYIETLLNEEFTSTKADPKFFDITFTFDIEYKEMVDAYIKNNGKSGLVELLLQRMEGIDA